MQLDTVLEAHLDMPAIHVVAQADGVFFGEGPLREDGDAVIALLAVDGLVDIAQLPERLGGKEVVHDLGFLQAEHVGLLPPEEQVDEAEPQADRVDIPGGELHAVN